MFAVARCAPLGDRRDLGVETGDLPYGVLSLRLEGRVELDVGVGDGRGNTCLVLTTSGELLAARLHGEPLPLDARLAQALGTQRLWSRSLQEPW